MLAIAARTGEHSSANIKSSCLLVTTDGCLLRRAAELLPKAAILICDEANSRAADMTVLHALLKHMLIFMRLRRTAILMSVALDLHVITILCRCHAARSYDFCSAQNNVEAFIASSLTSGSVLKK